MTANAHKPAPLLTGLSQAPVDLIAAVDDAFIARFNLVKGECVQLTLTQAEALAQALPNLSRQPGGAVGNALSCYAALGGKAALMGALANDALGHLFLANLQARGIAWENGFVSHANQTEENLGTTRVFCLTTPDAQRSFATYQGVNTCLDTSVIRPDLLAQSDLILFDGFTIPSPHVADTYLYAAEKMRLSGGQSAMMIGDVSILRDFPDRILPVLDIVDSILLNEVEAGFLLSLPCNSQDDKQILVEQLATRYAFGCMTCGADGAFVFQDGQVHFAPTPVTNRPIVDTNGAGDNFTGGFLYGLRRGMSLAQAARIGHACAASVISHFGARLAPDYQLPAGLV